MTTVLFVSILDTVISVALRQTSASANCSCCLRYEGCFIHTTFFLASFYRCSVELKSGFTYPLRNVLFSVILGTFISVFHYFCWMTWLSSLTLDTMFQPRMVIVPCTKYILELFSELFFSGHHPSSTLKRFLQLPSTKALWKSRKRRQDVFIAPAERVLNVSSVV